MYLSWLFIFQMPINWYSIAQTVIIIIIAAAMVTAAGLSAVDIGLSLLCTSPERTLMVIISVSRSL